MYTSLLASTVVTLKTSLSRRARLALHAHMQVSDAATPYSCCCHSCKQGLVKIPYALFAGSSGRTAAVCGSGQPAAADLAQDSTTPTPSASLLPDLDQAISHTLAAPDGEEDGLTCMVMTRVYCCVLMHCTVLHAVTGHQLCVLQCNTNSNSPATMHCFAYTLLACC